MSAPLIGPEYCRLMARYNTWQNRSLYTAAAGLSEADRQADRGAFWHSMQGTLSHLMWGDLTWLSRFDGGPGAQGSGKASDRAYDWAALMAERPDLDARIMAWAEAVPGEDLTGDLTWYSGFLGRDVSKPKGLCVIQFFNHQTHHRGQVHAMLTAAGARPDDTDLPFMPEDLPPWP
ncbi:MAG: DinB family protein [Pseudomonadota bacterium]